MKRIITKIILSLTLVIGAGSIVAPGIAPTQNVQAVSKLDAVSYARGYRKVKITKRTNVAKIHLRIPRYKSTVSNNYYVAKGDIVYIWRTGTDFGWYLKPYRHSKATYTVDRRLNDSSWYTLK